MLRRSIEIEGQKSTTSKAMKDCLSYLVLYVVEPVEDSFNVFHWFRDS